MSSKPIGELLNDLQDISEEIYQDYARNSLLEEKRPDWIDRYISDAEKGIINELSQKKQVIEVLDEELSKLKKLDRLLYSSGEILEDAVEYLFTLFKLNSERSEPGSPYDIKIKDLLESGEIYVEITAQAKIKKNSSKMGQILDIFRIYNPESDKILLVLNSLRNDEPSERSLEKIITPPVMNILNANKISVVQTTLLFEMWKKLNSKEKTIDEIHTWLKNKIEKFEPF